MGRVDKFWLKKNIQVIQITQMQLIPDGKGGDDKLIENDELVVFSSLRKATKMFKVLSKRSRRKDERQR